MFYKIKLYIDLNILSSNHNTDVFYFFKGHTGSRVDIQSYMHVVHVFIRPNYRSTVYQLFLKYVLISLVTMGS